MFVRDHFLYVLAAEGTSRQSPRSGHTNQATNNALASMPMAAKGGWAMPRMSQNYLLFLAETRAWRPRGVRARAAQARALSPEEIVRDIAPVGRRLLRHDHEAWCRSRFRNAMNHGGHRR